jgi:eukaryotic-like serine/threonine-protein kinase
MRIEAPSPRRCGPFQLMERIGRGGMAEVFRAAVDGAPGLGPMAVKRIRADRRGDPAMVRLLHEEARLSALLQHPNIVEVYDLGCADGDYFLSMEYLPGRDLGTVLKTLRGLGQAMPPPIAAYVARELGQGLGYVHGLSDRAGRPLGIVHRDVAPSNVMLLGDGTVKLLDFGIAKASMRAAGDGEPARAARALGRDDTDAGTLRGKLGYLAPERIEGRPADASSDLYALGVVLWEMLAGRRLFGAANDLEALVRLVDRPLPRPSLVRPEVPAVLDAVVTRALCPLRLGRWTSAVEMAEALARYLDGSACGAGDLAAWLRGIPARAPVTPAT